MHKRRRGQVGKIRKQRLILKEVPAIVRRALRTKTDADETLVEEYGFGRRRMNKAQVTRMLKASGIS